MIHYIQLEKSLLKDKKFKATFFDINKKKIKTTHFGSKNYSDYTLHKNLERKNAYILRHGREDWTDPTKASTLSRYILWNKTSLSASFTDFLNKFKLFKY